MLKIRTQFNFRSRILQGSAEICLFETFWSIWRLPYYENVEKSKIWYILTHPSTYTLKMWLLTGELLVSQPSSANVLTVEGQLRGLPAGLYQGNQPMAFENTTSHLFVSKIPPRTSSSPKIPSLLQWPWKTSHSDLNSLSFPSTVRVHANAFENILHPSNGLLRLHSINSYKITKHQ